MTIPNVDVTKATELVAQAQSVIDTGVKRLSALGGPDKEQTLAYDLAHAASAIATARACLSYAAKGTQEADLTAAFLAIALSDLATRILGREELWGVESDWY